MATPENTPPANTNIQPRTVTMDKSGVFAPMISDYELSREERIKENRERMQKLGIADLSLKLNDLIKPTPKRSYQKKHHHCRAPLPTSGPTRRSSRLQNTAPVSYCEVPVPKKEKHSNRGDILREVGSKPEAYTEEHEQLLGSMEKSWVPFVDGYGKDGKRIYDPVKGKTCHQCRQKTLGHRTRCSQCSLVQGQFCGDCLYMRYGENVLEANENPDWICPVCRGICNCSLCRLAKGWPPTGSLYRKISNLGFKSVAHYLIQTQRSNTELNNSSNDNNSGTEHVQVSAKRSLPFSDIDAAKGDDDDLSKSSDEHSNTDHSITKLEQETGDSKINPVGEDRDLSKSSNGHLNTDHPITKLDKESGDSKINPESEVELPLKPEPEILAAGYDINKEADFVVDPELNESTIKPETVTETEGTIEPLNDLHLHTKLETVTETEATIEPLNDLHLHTKPETVTETEATIEPLNDLRLHTKPSERGGDDDEIIKIANKFIPNEKGFVALEEKSPKSSKKCAGYEPKTPDSIGGRLRQRHNQTNESIASRLKRRRIEQ